MFQTVILNSWFNAALPVSAGVLVMLVLGGCAGSIPTRGEYEGEKRLGVIQEEDEFKFITKIRRESAREDDRKVSPEVLSQLGSSEEYDASIPEGLNRDNFLLEVVRYLGAEYSYGGNSRNGIDCSGYTCQVYKNAAGKLLPRSTAEQFRVGSEVQKRNLRFGDLVFFNTTGRSPSHVGIYIEDGVFAHASVIEGVTLSTLESTYYKRRFVGARRVIE
ncbi:MAG: C40 family peptidase [Bacteroidetes bacterium]|nr:C40 family peptidase [Bacteroidota bacterium]MCW5895236.1 C40 family peptidase [Bacteroidota bacterium]